MINDSTAFPRINELLSRANSGAIVLTSNPSADAVAAAVTLYLGLSKIGKNLSIVCSQEINIPEIIGTDKIQSELVTSGDNLVISFPYKEGSIDKVDYNIQGNFFNLIITPRPNFPKLATNQVKFSYTGGKLDFIITIDAPTLNNLGDIYTNNQSQFQGKDIVNIDRHLTNSYYGTINLVNKTASSLAETILKLLQNLQVEIDRDMATNLYFGISAATNNFSSYSVNADTFETVAQLLRLGAIKKTYKKTIPNNSIPSAYPQMNFPQPRNVVSPQPKNPPQPRTQTQNLENQNAKPIEIVEKETHPEEGNPPQEWLKPKIFRGGDLI